MSDRDLNQNSNIVPDDHQLECLEEKVSEIIASPHHGYADASRVVRLEEKIEALDKRLHHERLERAAER